MAMNGVQSLNRGDAEYIKELERVIDDLTRRLKAVESSVNTLGRV